MGAMLMSGLTLAGASIAIALLANSVHRVATPSSAAEPIPAGRIAIILFAFAQGIAVLAVVQGLLAIYSGGLSDSSAGWFAGLPAIAGSIVGLAMITRRGDENDRRTSTLGKTFILGLGVLGASVAALAILTNEGGTNAAFNALYPALGVAGALAALGVGFVGSAGLRAEQAGGDAALNDPEVYKAAANRLLARCLPFLAIGWGAGMAAIILRGLE